MALLPYLAIAQATFDPDTVRAGRFDNGKMWTFDIPPVEHFERTYGFKPDKQWWEAVRLSALRFATWCSASFVSADGLVMTNHHCSRDVALKVQRAGENFLANGFYAPKLADERKVPDLFVDQLLKIEDITDQVEKALAGVPESEQATARDKAFAEIREAYKAKPEWKDLTLQIITFYNGGKYSIYGFKRYNDVRLVFIPELDLGFFGGDPDNFTYPRYALDCTFFRVYDEQGKPFRPPYYFKFNIDGVKENEPVFVIGNPGRTNRVTTIANLEFRRDLQLPTTLRMLKNRSLILQEYAKIAPTQAERDSLINEVFSLENSYKAQNGMLRGMQDAYTMTRRKAFQNQFRAAVKNNPKLAPDEKVWADIEALVQEQRKLFPDANCFTPSAMQMGETMMIAMLMADFAETKNPKNKPTIEKFSKPKVMSVEEAILAAYLEETALLLGKNDDFIQKATQLSGANPENWKAIAKGLIEKTKLYDKSFIANFLEKPEAAENEVFFVLAKIASARGKKASDALRAMQGKALALNGKLARLLFEVYGTSIPPDATFSLRINDGVVKSYEYNGTTAPIKTTFYGMYDRYYSFDKKFPWSLPKRWLNPPAELLQSPMNFVTTNDIIGGNSGSPMINRNREAIGLVFDGNIESLPGNFIYDDTKNRAVGVHAGGIIAALRYIYKADRLWKELLEQKK